MRSRDHHDEARGDATTDAPAPGRRTLTMGMPARAAAEAPVQRKASAAATTTDDAFAVHLGGAGGATHRGAPRLIVDDGAEVHGNQMTRSQYLTELREAVIDTARQVLHPTWSAEQCPDLKRIFAHYATLDAAAIEAVSRRFGRGGGATPADYIARVCARIVGTIHRWGAGEDMTWDVGTAGVPVALEAVAGPAAAGDAAAPVTQLHGGGGAARGASVDPTRDLGGGGALDATTAGRMGAAFGDSFADVVVHTDGAAAATTRALGADALATGSHIAFASGAYQPGTPAGDGLIAHELAHVIQQRGGGASTSLRPAAGIESSAAHERDADDAAAAVVARLHHGADGDAPIRPALAIGPGVQRGNRSDESEPSKPKPLVTKPKVDESKSSEDKKVPERVRRTVERVLPGVKLPKENKEKWNFGQDEEGEREYNTAKRLIELCEGLQSYAIEHQLIVAPALGEDKGLEYYQQYGSGSDYSSSYHSAGGQNKPAPWRDAGRLGYDLADTEIRKRVGQIADAYHSMMYLSDVSRTGILI